MTPIALQRLEPVRRQRGRIELDGDLGVVIEVEQPAQAGHDRDERVGRQRSRRAAAPMHMADARAPADERRRQRDLALEPRGIGAAAKFRAGPRWCCSRNSSRAGRRTARAGRATAARPGRVRRATWRRSARRPPARNGARSDSSCSAAPGRRSARSGRLSLMSRLLLCRQASIRPRRRSRIAAANCAASA